MRRVAIAGILAMNPDVLVLDEPTAGLDPQGQYEMMEMFNTLHKQYGKTIVLVTHDMNLVAEYAEEMIVMHRGVMKLKGTPQQVFKEVEALKEVWNYVADCRTKLSSVSEKSRIICG